MKINKTTLKNFSLVALGTLVLAFGTAVFILPFSLVTGGVSGIAIIVDSLIPAEAVTVDLLVAIFTWTLFFVGLIFLGKSFALKTLESSLLYPLFVSLFTRLVSPEALGGYFSLETSSLGGASVILAGVFGGVFIGLGCALTFLGGGSTGGVDIIAFLICKINKKIKSSYSIFFVDAVIILFGAFVTADLSLTLLGIVTALVGAVIIDKVFLGAESAFAANIVTTNAEEIVSRIISDLDRTATVTDAEGGYSKEPRKVVFVTFNLREYPRLIALISELDKGAFVTLTRVHEIKGEGWSE